MKTTKKPSKNKSRSRWTLKLSRNRRSKQNQIYSGKPFLL